MVEVKGVKVAVAGFSSYVWSNSLVDIADGQEGGGRRPPTMADLVVVQVHMGAEGADKTRVKPGTEMFLGENRGDPVTFSHADDRRRAPTWSSGTARTCCAAWSSTRAG